MVKISSKAANDLRITMLQINPMLGDVTTNTEKIINLAKAAIATETPDLIVCPEFSLTGYPLEDLVYRDSLHTNITTAINKLLHADLSCMIAIGCPTRSSGLIYNSILLIKNNKIISLYNKRELPNYAIFDDKRYFNQGDSDCIVEIKGIKLGFLICEDIWFDKQIASTKQAGAELIISMNASPFAYDKMERRIARIKDIADKFSLPMIYVNLAGGQDEIVFDGGSFVSNNQGEIVSQAKYFAEDILTVDFNAGNGWSNICRPKIQNNKTIENIYLALVTGVKDYINKNNFPGAILGLSGGIDSALMLCIAVDAIGAASVMAVLMPSRYTADISNEDAMLQAKALGVETKTIAIEPIFSALMSQLEFTKREPDLVEQNIQARCRGTLLMALSNQNGKIVLVTSNRSEMAVGYSTLYGDMAGGFAALKDIPKTMVYELANYRNSIQAVIPSRVISRAPSAELAPGQVDQDSLPPYNILDDIIYRYINLEQDIKLILQETNYDKDIVTKVIKLINRSEYKRRQAPIGVRISSYAFGKDRRYPITAIIP
jgi:NAD+ synthase (glutamine-hydrolysing)